MTTLVTSAPWPSRPSPGCSRSASPGPASSRRLRGFRVRGRMPWSPPSRWARWAVFQARFDAAGRRPHARNRGPPTQAESASRYQPWFCAALSPRRPTTSRRSANADRSRSRRRLVPARSGSSGLRPGRRVRRASSGHLSDAATLACAVIGGPEVNDSFERGGAGAPAIKPSALAQGDVDLARLQRRGWSTGRGAQHRLRTRAHRDVPLAHRRDRQGGATGVAPPGRAVGRVQRGRPPARGSGSGRGWCGSRWQAVTPTGLAPWWMRSARLPAHRAPVDACRRARRAGWLEGTPSAARAAAETLSNRHGTSHGARRWPRSRCWACVGVSGDPLSEAALAAGDELDAVGAGASRARRHGARRRETGGRRRERPGRAHPQQAHRDRTGPGEDCRTRRSPSRLHLLRRTIESHLSAASSQARRGEPGRAARRDAEPRPPTHPDRPRVRAPTEVPARRLWSRWSWCSRSRPHHRQKRAADEGGPRRRLAPAMTSGRTSSRPASCRMPGVARHRCGDVRLVGRGGRRPRRIGLRPHRPADRRSGPPEHRRAPRPGGSRRSPRWRARVGKGSIAAGGAGGGTDTVTSGHPGAYGIKTGPGRRGDRALRHLHASRGDGGRGASSGGSTRLRAGDDRRRCGSAGNDEAEEREPPARRPPPRASDRRRIDDDHLDDRRDGDHDLQRRTQRRQRGRAASRSTSTLRGTPDRGAREHDAGHAGGKEPDKDAAGDPDEIVNDDGSVLQSTSSPR